MIEPLKGRLLVAAPTLLDPNFDRTVVLVLEHSDDGAVGLVLNRPSDTGLDEPLPAWRWKAADPPVVFVGGPVSQTAAIAIGRAGGGDVSEGFAPLFAGLGTVDVAQDPDDVGDVEVVRIFAGYAGWGAGQLEGEIEQKAWFVVNSRPGDVFTQSPEDLWRQVLLREGGEARIYAFFPETPGLN
ncbi:MAG TPA: YqgE/AlgH family protein [Planctomycetaceae bacterium]